MLTEYTAHLRENPARKFWAGRNWPGFFVGTEEDASKLRKGNPLASGMQQADALTDALTREQANEIAEKYPAAVVQARPSPLARLLTFWK